MQSAAQVRLAAAGVTAREAEVLAAIGRRLTNREIAAQMFISVRTVESHVSALLRKLELAGRPDLIELSLEIPRGPVLPAPATSFVGRTAELAGLAGMLPGTALISLVGPAGCGKTRLALETARAWPGEVRMADFALVTARDATAAAAALGPPPGSPAQGEPANPAAGTQVAGPQVLRGIRPGAGGAARQPKPGLDVSEPPA